MFLVNFLDVSSQVAIIKDFLVVESLRTIPFIQSFLHVYRSKKSGQSGWTHFSQ